MRLIWLTLASSSIHFKMPLQRFSSNCLTVEWIETFPTTLRDDNGWFGYGGEMTRSSRWLKLHPRRFHDCRDA
jgi:hypothetical protein